MSALARLNCGCHNYKQSYNQRMAVDDNDKHRAAGNRSDSYAILHFLYFDAHRPNLCFSRRRRFSRPGDAVLVTGADDQSLASLVLGTRRTIIVVVSDGAKQAEVSKELDTACGEALECGHFAQLSRPHPKR